MRVRTAREIGLLARTERKRQGLTLQAVADRVGCTRQWIASLEAGGERLELALVLRTLSALGVQLDARAPVSGGDGAA
ncbi:MAG TPA: helix-turn-helix domain-containing protein [Longimicrobium sp.]|nr:helix-turn-helix domain-containing protein [Longimicrobium sp.]